MLWILAFHIIFMVAWFAGLFYLPRLFVYHADCNDAPGHTRFKIMEHKLFYYIMTPAGIVTTILGLWLLNMNRAYYLHQGWMWGKIVLVGLLWIYHIYCGVLVKRFNKQQNYRSHVFYRWFNEIPTMLLIAIVLLAILKP